MKRTHLFCCSLFLLLGLISGCGLKNVAGVRGSGNAKTETRNASGFKAVKAENAVNVEITVQKDFALTIEADDNLLEHVRTDVSGGTLTVGVKDSISPKTKITVRISMPELTELNVSGASTANVAQVKTDSLKITASGASKIQIDGEVKNVEAVASGASGIDAEQLRTENAKANASGASSVTVSPTGELDADASGASSVYYTGEPKNIKQNSSGASSVKKK